MDQHRLGTCSSCDAKYRIPATFKADKAKCKKCGGVVEIGAVRGEAPAKPAAAKPAPARKPRSAKPARKSSAPAKAAAKPSAEAEPKGESKGESVRAAAEEAAGRVRKSSGGKSGRAGARRKSARASTKKKSNTGVLLGIVALVLIAAGGGWFLWGKDSGSEAQAAESVAKAPEATETNGAEQASEETLEGASDEAAANLQDAEPATDEGEVASEEDEAVEEAAPPPPPEVIDLADFEDQPRAAATTDEEWAEIQQLVATMIDPEAGAKGARAGKALLAYGRKSFPAILNTFKTLDLSSPEGYANGDLLQKLLTDICQGNNFDWRYSTDEKDVVFNKKVVRAWFVSWGQAVKSEAQDGRGWVNLGKLNEEQKQAYLEEIGLEVAASADELEDF